jgi:two-component sensor histidine kinase
VMPIISENEAITGYVTVNRDITKRKQLELQLKKEKERLEVLSDLAGVFAEITSDYSYALTYTAEKIAITIGELCIIKLISIDNKQFEFPAVFHRNIEQRNYLLKLYHEAPDPIDSGYSSKVIRDSSPILITSLTDYSELRPTMRKYADKYGISSLVIVPIQAEGKTLGIINMSRNRPDNSYTNEDLMFLQSVAGKIGIGVSKARLFNEKLHEIEERKKIEVELTTQLTHIKVIEEKIKTALQEKEVLLRELYHRTKNNMQVINSLLGLRGELAREDSVKSILNDMKNRIQAIALVHQKLYQSKNLSRVDLKDYITEFTQLLMKSYSSVDKNIELKLDLESINVLIDTAVPCGLTINELLSNSFKYAFPEDREGAIYIGLHRYQTGNIELIVSDNGIGLPDGTSLITGNTIGSQLIYSIVEGQLNGELNMETKNGISCTIKFNDEIIKERI